MAKIKGGPGDDVLKGTNVADTITGGDGNDIIHGFDGNDDIQGGNGNDTLFGDAGNDSLQGGDGNDYLDGGIGIDQLNGGNGNDILVWDSADSVRAGGSGFDILLVQGSGKFVDLTVLHKDQFRSMEEVDLNGSGSNTLKVSANSIYEGDHDVNALTGTPDTLVVRLGEDDIVDKGTGWTEQTPQVHEGVLYRVYTKLNSALTTSTLLIESHKPIAIDDGPISFFDTGVHDTGNTNLLSNDFGAGGSAVTITNLSSLSTTGTNDNLFTISLSGLDINITLLPAINALIPADAVYFFGLKDNTASINVNTDGTVSVDTADGLLAFLSSTQTIKVSFDYSIIDGLGGTDTGHATVTINGLDNRDLLVAGVAGGETLNGADNGDLLISQGGDDVLNGNGGDDYLVGNGGNDTLNGGSDNDKLIGEQADFRIIHSSVSGNIDDPIPAFGSDTLSGDDGDDKLYGDLLTLTLKAEGGTDTFNLVAFTNLALGTDSLNGGNGNDELVGDVGNVNLIAINGNGSGAAVIEVVHMDFGADTLNGGNGADTLYGDVKEFSLSAMGAVGNGSDTRAEVSFNTFYFGSDTLEGVPMTIR